jgi:hypothetical protein
VIAAALLTVLWTAVLSSEGSQPVLAAEVQDVVSVHHEVLSKSMGAGVLAPIDVINAEVHVEPPNVRMGAHFVFVFQATTPIALPGEVWIQWREGYTGTSQIDDLGDASLEVANVAWSDGPDERDKVITDDLTIIPDPDWSGPPDGMNTKTTGSWIPDGQVRLTISDTHGFDMIPAGVWIRVDFWGPPSVNPGKEDAGITNPDLTGSYCFGMATEEEQDLVYACADVIAGGPPVIDGVFTGALIDGDGTATNGVGRAHPTKFIEQKPFDAADNVCYEDVDGDGQAGAGDAFWIDNGDGVYDQDEDAIIVGSPTPGAGTLVDALAGETAVAYNDAEIDDNNSYDDGEDIYLVDSEGEFLGAPIQRVVYDPLVPYNEEVLAHIYIANTTNTVFMHNDFIVDSESIWIDGDGTATEDSGAQTEIGFRPFTNAISNTLNVQLFGRWFTTDDDVYWKAALTDTWSGGLDYLWLDVDDDGIYNAGSDQVIFKGMWAAPVDGDTGRELNSDGPAPTYNFTYNDENGNAQWDDGEDIGTLDGDEIYDWNYFDDRWSWLVDGDGVATDDRGDEDLTRIDGNTWFQAGDAVYHWDADGNGDWNKGDGLWIDADGNGEFEDDADELLVRGNMTGGETGKLLQVDLVDGDGSLSGGAGSENTTRHGQTAFALTDNVFWYDADDDWFWSTGDGLWIDEDGDGLFSNAADSVILLGDMSDGVSGARLSASAHHFGYDDGEVAPNGQYDLGEDVYAANTYLAYDDFEVDFNGAYDSGEDIYDRDYIEIWVYAEGDAAQVPIDMHHPELEPGLRDVGFRVHVNGIRVDDPSDDYDAPTGFQAAAGWGRSRGAPTADAPAGGYNRHYEYKLTSAAASTQTHMTSNGMRVDTASPKAPRGKEINVTHKIDWETCEMTSITHWKDLVRGRDPGYQEFGSSSGQREETVMLDWLHPTPPLTSPFGVGKNPLSGPLIPDPFFNRYCWNILIYNLEDEPRGPTVLSDTLPDGWFLCDWDWNTHPPTITVEVDDDDPSNPVIRLPDGLPSGSVVQVTLCACKEGPVEQISNRVEGETDHDNDPDTEPKPIPPVESSIPALYEPEILLFKIADSAEVTPGGRVIWRIGVINTGRVAVNKARIEEELPAGLTSDGAPPLPDTLGPGHVSIIVVEAEVSDTLAPSTTLTNTVTLEGEFTTSSGETRAYSTSVSASVHVTEVVPVCTVEKSIWINGEGPYSQENGPFDVAISDTVEIRDAVHCNFDWDGGLVGTWSPSYLELEQSQATHGDIVEIDVSLGWDITPTVPASTTVVLTRTYHVTGAHLVSETFTLDDQLAIYDYEVFDQPVEFHWSEGCSWEKNVWINRDGPYNSADGPFDVVVSDTIWIMDVVHCDFEWNGTLTETWPSAYMELRDAEVNSGNRTFDQTAGTLTWNVPSVVYTTTVPASKRVYLFKEFHVENTPPVSDTFTLDEGLDILEYGSYISEYGSFDKPVQFHSKGEYTWDRRAWINGTGPYTSASFPLEVTVSDTVKIRNAIHHDADWSGTLTEWWASSQMQLQGTEVSHGSVTSTSDSLDWVISPTVPASTTVILTKTFHISGEFLVSDTFYLDEWLQIPGYETSHKPITFHVDEGCSWDKEWWFAGEAVRYDPGSTSASVAVSNTIKIRDVLHHDLQQWNGTLTETWPTAYVNLQGVEVSHGDVVTEAGGMSWMVTPTVPISTHVILTKTLHISATPLLTSDWFYVRESLDVPGYGKFNNRDDKQVYIQASSGCSWGKDVWINGGGPFDSDTAPFKVVPSDTVKIRDVLRSDDFAWNGVLTETWPTAYMELQNVEVSSGEITTDAGGMSWVITPTVTTSTQVILTKTFHISATPPVAESFLLNEHLVVPGHGEAEQPVSFRASSSFGTLPVNDDEESSIRGKGLFEMLNQHIPVTKSHSALLIFTQCYGGNMMDNFRGRAKTGVTSASSRDETAKYGGYHEGAAEALKPGPGRTSDDVHADGIANKKNGEHPVKAGETIPLTPTNPAGPIKSRHVLVYAGKPEYRDNIDRIKIQNNFANQPNTTVTTVGGSGGPGWDYAGTREGLRKALEEIGQQMNSDEQFILFVTDHGDLHPEKKDVSVASSSDTLVDIGIPDSLVDDMNNTTENDYGTGISIEP